jgi:hypothetical protein
VLEFLTAYEQLTPGVRDEFVEPFLARIEASDRSYKQRLLEHCAAVVARLSEVTGTGAPVADAQEAAKPSGPPA